jgi:triosephosphate isomerase
MHGLAPQLDQIKAIAASVKAAPPHADVIVWVPPGMIDRAVQVSAGIIAIGGEDCSAEKAGAFTSDVDADMLRDAGATAVIPGHSERGRIHQKTDAMVAAKAAAAWGSGLSTIIGIGETQEQRSAGKALAVCGSQLAGSLPEIPPGCENSFAYRALWAIGSGQIPTEEDIVAEHSHIWACLVARFHRNGQAMRTLYGGSVTSFNACWILGLSNVGGVLIGGASLMASDFDAILQVSREMSCAPDAEESAMKAPQSASR